MMHDLKWPFMVVVLWGAAFLQTFAQPASVSVNAASAGARIGSLHYGLFYEEINHAGNAGLWAEMIKNRSFEDGTATDGWTKLTSGGAAGTLTTDTNNPLNACNRTELAVNVTAVGTGSCGVCNAGFFNDLSIVAGKSYNCVVYARKAAGFSGNLNVQLEDASAAASNLQSIPNSSLATSWTKFSFTLTASRTLSPARLAITTQSTGTFYLTYVSLMPAEAADGFRPDLLQKLKDLNPGFVRFPGGCYVEGNVLAEAWLWKGGIGPQEGRRTHWNLWGYWDNNGLGLYEYLLLCEKLGAEPLLVVNVGMAHGDSVTGAALDPYLQNALDAIAFANADATNSWGAQRAAMGHPAPFGLKYMEIGNENGGGTYSTNYAVYYNTIKSNYPSMNLVADVWGGTPNSAPVDFIDEHYYTSPDWFAQEGRHYDTYSRTGPKIYVGEYAVTVGAGMGNLAAGLGEVMWMMGMERNADIVTMCSYAPLFVNVNNRAWNPDLIAFDARSAYGTPSYYVQKLMFNNRGDVNLMTTASGPARTISMLNGGVGAATWATQAEYGDVLVTNGSTTLYQSSFTSTTAGWTTDGGTWNVTGGNLRQTDAAATDCRNVYYAPDWTNYTLTLKARKLSGSEGFLILFRATDHNNYYWWNLGGWGNTRTVVERCANGGKAAACAFTTNTIQTNVWYYIKIVAQADHIQCYLRPETQPGYTLVHDFTDNPSYPGFDAVAALEESSGDILVKVVNRTGNTLTNTPLIVTNTGWPRIKAMVTTLASASDLDENSLANPAKVTPVESQFAGASFPLNCTFQPFSLTVLRLSPDLASLATITATAGTGGSIAPAGAVLVLLGNNQTFNIASSANYTLTNVLVDGVWQGPVGSFTFTNVMTIHTIAASFAPITHVITASAGANGAISPAGPVTVIQGAVQTFTFAPDSGYMVDTVLVDGVSTGRANSYTFTNVMVDHTISVCFKTLVAYVITATAGTNGSISPSGAVQVLQGWNQAFTIDADYGAIVSNVVVDGVSKGALASYVFTNVTAAHTIAASFFRGAPPVVWYKFDESSGTAAADSSGNGRNATLVNTPAWVTGLYSNAVSLNGVNQYLTCPSGFVSALSNFTISAWVNLDSAPTWSRIFDFGTGTGGYMFLSPQGGAGKLRYAITTGGGEQQIDGPAVLPTGSWQHIAVTLSGSTGVLWVNGLAVATNASMTLKPLSLGNTTQNYIGKSQYNDPYLNGVVDDFRIYARALPASDMMSLYYGGRTITASAGPGGSITPSGAVLVNYGLNQSFSITVSNGFTIASVTVDGVSQGATNAYTFSNVIADHTIGAAFASAIPPSLTISANSSGGLDIYWPDTYSGQLLASPVLGPGAFWQPAGTTTHTNGVYKVTVTPTNAAAFYYLGY